jgi:uncharacterized membrane protein YdjX (TVP38/TMEM64 family)
VTSKSKHHKTSKLPLIISLTLLAALISSYFFIPSFEGALDEAFHVLTSNDQERIREWVSQFKFWGPLVIIFTMVLQMFLFVVPNILLIMISILSYGPFWGSLLAWFGVFLASTVGYFIGNKLSPVIVSKLVSEKTQETLREFIREYGMKAIVVIRLSTFSNDGLSIVAGLLRMKYRRFIIATLIGITPLIAILAIYGRSGKIKEPLLLTGGILIICLVIYIIVDMRRKRRKKR